MAVSVLDDVDDMEAHVKAVSRLQGGGSRLVLMTWETWMHM